MKSLAGKFLLATPMLVDPNFARAVVLIIRHDDDGAFGFIINRPMPATVADAIGPSVEAAAECNDPVYFGGPCQGPVFAFHQHPLHGGEEPLSGVYVTTERHVIESLLTENAQPMKILATYSGWGSEQLESEMAEGSWIVCEAKPDDIFDADKDLWSRLHTRINLGRYVRPDQIPDDPSLN
ncbi:MAG TPA: YqgE/AlgH family protein [Tepidisphaeraceae bacterium]|jgi:putative transcriptional regulator